MALQKQNVNINFSQGLDTKTDPWQVTAGKMLSLKNTVFNKGGQLQKRNGFKALESLSNTTSTTLTTFLDNLIAVGQQFNVRSPDTNQWYNRGSFEPVDLEVIPTVRTSTSLATADIAVASNLLSCSVFSDTSLNSFYQINDSQTGQVVTSIIQLPATARNPRVFCLSQFFIITYVATVTGSPHLQYISIPFSTPLVPASALDLATNIDSLTAAYDGVVYNNKFYFAYNASDLAGAVRINSLDSNFNISSPKVLAGSVADLLSLCVDSSGSTPVLWVSFYTSGANELSTAAFNQNLLDVLTVTVVETALTLYAITSCAQDMVLTLFYENISTYSYSSVRSDYISKITCSQAGVIGSPSNIIRSLGLASKSFYRESNGTYYFLGVYGGSLQPTYFLIDEFGIIVSKLAYSNAYGYMSSQVLPSVTVNGETIQIGYLFKSTLVSVNKSQGISQSTGVYAQAGMNLLTLTFGDSSLGNVDIGNNLHITGGYMWMYDGAKPVEHSFHVWPEDLGYTSSPASGGLKAQQYFYKATYEWTDAQGNLHRSAPSTPLSVDLSSVTPTGLNFQSVFISGVTTIVVSSLTGLFVGQRITDTTTGGNIAANTVITSIDTGSSSITINNPTLGASAASPGDTLHTVDTISVTMNVPTLRLTSKTGVNPVRIVLYRWSTDQQIYYQDTLIQTPTLNSTTVDSVAISDTRSDAAILGNVILYTEGGVVENIAAPSCSALTLFKSRLILLDSEDRNLVWYSKQVIESTPVEMSDLFTIYVAPTISAQGSTGPITALSAMDDKLIIFKENAIYYITGTGPDNTGANNDFTDPVFITSTVGCTNQQSIVFMPQGIMFQSNKGIWLLGRDLSTTYIGSQVEDFNAAQVLSAVNVPATNQVRFTLDTDVTLMYDYFFGQWGTFVGIPSISSTIYQSLHTYLNSFGQVYQETPASYLDGSIPVVMSFTTSWFNLAGLQGYQRAYFFYILGQYITPHKLSVEISYDYNPYPTQTSIISPLNYNPTYGGDVIYGSGSPYGGSSAVEDWRVFLQTQKCQSFQITINEMYDATLGVSAGEGLTLSGLDLIVGTKSGYPRLKAAVSVG